MVYNIRMKGVCCKMNNSTSNELKIFTNKEFGNVRVKEIDGEPWFVAADVCKSLDINNPRQAVTKLDEDEKMTVTTNDGHSGKLGGAQMMNVINESGLYELVLRSRKPEAKAFKRWITHEVIPDIRKHGMYATPTTIQSILDDPDSFIKMIEAYKEEKRMRIEAQNKIKQDAPKVLFADAVSASETSILIGDLAKLLRQNGVNIGQNRFFQWMRKNGFLTRHNAPTQKSMDMELFEVLERTVNNPDGSVRIVRTTKALPKAQIYFVNKFLNDPELVNKTL